LIQAISHQVLEVLVLVRLGQVTLAISRLELEGQAAVRRKVQSIQVTALRGHVRRLIPAIIRPVSVALVHDHLTLAIFLLVSVPDNPVDLAVQ
jgi:hypothetical protein